MASWWSKINPEKKQEYSRKQKEWSLRNPEKQREYARQWHIRNPEYARTWQNANNQRLKIRWLQRKLSLSIYDAGLLVALRDGEGAWCDVCRTTEGPFAIDHNHNTMKVRGLLCYRCNIGIGFIESFPLGEALKYLEESDG